MATNAGGEKDGKRRALGRGLESLLPKAAPRSAAGTQNDALRDGAESAGSGGKGDAAGGAAGSVSTGTVVVADGRPFEIAVELVDKSPYQTRSYFDEALLNELTESVRAVGVIQPVLVRVVEAGRYQLIAGERRWLASKRAGRATIPAVVAVMNDAQAMEATIIENLQRADLNPIEQARAFERLGREFKMTQDQMAIKTGKDRASIANFLRLLKLPEDLQKHVEADTLSFGHARALLSLENQEQMRKAAQKIFQLSMSVRQAETFVRGILNPERREATPKTQEPIDPNVREAQNTLRAALGMKVQIEDKNGRGRVVIEYANLEAFDELMERLTG